MMFGLFLIVLFSSLAIGVPVAFSLILSGIALMVAMGIFDSQIIVQNMIYGTNNFALMAIPFFILAGELMNKGGISKRIVIFVSTLVGHVRGGLGYVAIIASIIFAGLSGSAIADAAALGSILIPMMTSKGYKLSRATGIIVSAGILAPIIPPSIGLILYGVASGTSIIALFMGGLTPGIIIGVSLMIVWYCISRKDTMMEITPRKSLKEVFDATKQAFWALILPVIILGGLRGGIFTPTEAGVIAVVYALIVGMFIHREINITDLGEIFIATTKTTGAVMFVVAAAMVSAWMITVANVPTEMAKMLGPLITQPLLLMLIINIILLFVGMVMDITPAILILTPVLLPIVKQAGVDPVYFGVIMIINLCIGLITPPVGTVLYVGSGLSKLNIMQVAYGALPFIVVEILMLLLFILFPSIILAPLKILL
jgi:TRAP-type transport system large permease protein